MPQSVGLLPGVQVPSLVSGSGTQLSTVVAVATGRQGRRDRGCRRLE